MKKLLAFSTIFLLSVSLTHAQCKCCEAPYTDFHFWEGEWEVFNTKNQLIGYNTLTVEQDSCVMRENWRSANGKSKGTSINFYDATLKQWRQVWVDNNGWVLELYGSRKGNQMVLKSKEMTNPKGEKVFHRITWTKNEDNTVRQHWESSKDGEETWTTVFDGLYKPAIID